MLLLAGNFGEICNYTDVGASKIKKKANKNETFQDVDSNESIGTNRFGEMGRGGDSENRSSPKPKTGNYLNTQGG